MFWHLLARLACNTCTNTETQQVLITQSLELIKK